MKHHPDPFSLNCPHAPPSNNLASLKQSLNSSQAPQALKIKHWSVCQGSFPSSNIPFPSLPKALQASPLLLLWGKSVPMLTFLELLNTDITQCPFLLPVKFDGIIKQILETAYWKRILSLKSTAFTTNSFHFALYLVIQRKLKLICWFLYSSLLNYFLSWAVKKSSIYIALLYENFPVKKE